MAELEPQGQVSVTTDPEGFMASMRAKLSAEAEPETQPDEGEASPAPAAEASAPAPVAAGAADAATAPEPAVTSWRDVPIPEDVAAQYRFFNGKKTGDLYESYRSLERTLQEKGKRERELETELIALKTAKEVFGAAQAPAEPPKQRDPFEGLDPDVDPIANPAKWQAAQQEQMRRELESVKEQAKRETLTEIESRQAVLAQQAHEAAVTRTLMNVQSELGLDDAKFGLYVPSLVNAVTKYIGAHAQTDPKAYLEVARELGIQPKPLAAPPPAPPPSPANPPGSKRSANSAEPTRTVPTVKAETRRMLKAQRDAYAAAHGEEKADQFFERSIAALAAKGY